MEPTTFIASGIIKTTGVILEGLVITAAATAVVLEIRRGPLVTSPVILEIRVPINTTKCVYELGINCPTGIYANLVSGVVFGTVIHN
tara:strand:- start:1186 stop:1446 length:261 start_codon:yes stop_codon:yes gene_type:complete